MGDNITQQLINLKLLDLAEYISKELIDFVETVDRQYGFPSRLEIYLDYVDFEYNYNNLMDNYLLIERFLFQRYGWIFKPNTKMSAATGIDDISQYYNSMAFRPKYIKEWEPDCLKKKLYGIITFLN